MTEIRTQSGLTVAVGNLFASDAQTLVNTVNTVGVMGKGVALEFRRRFPDMYADYLDRCAVGEVRMGRPYLYRRLLPPFILNFPTKEHWRSVSRLSDIIEGLNYLETHYSEWGITSLACPPLGCGNGGLEWRIVGPLLASHLARLSIPVTLFAPHGTTSDQLSPEFLGGDAAGAGTEADSDSRPPSRVPAGWIGLAAVLERLSRNPHRWPTGRTIFQKLAYFTTSAGLPTGLTFKRGSYGPYADSMHSVQVKLVNNGILVEEPRGNRIEYRVGPTFEAAAREYERELEEWSDTIQSVAALMARMSTRQAEVAATAHFVARGLLDDGRRVSERDVYDAAHAWKQNRKPPLRDEEIAAAIRNLALLGWLEVERSDDVPVVDLSEAAF
jgi:uncharacterized protein YwgA/O-acetyl-ADP-ribose deacetylase (regulator of RNase III)